MCPHKENEEEGLDIDRLEDSCLTVEAEVGGDGVASLGA